MAVRHTASAMAWEALTGPGYALPLDLFRVLVGVLTLAYFWRAWREASLFSGPDGLLDHALQRRLDVSPNEAAVPRAARHRRAR